MKINILTVTYGKRFHLLKQVLDSVVEDEYTNKIILVDNNSEDKEKIDNYIQENNKKENKKEIILIRHTENTGSAGGFSSGIEEAKKHPADYLFLLDDDNVPEKEWGEKIENILIIFGDEAKNKIFSLERNSGDINSFRRREYFLDRKKLFSFSFYKPSHIINFIFRGRKDLDKNIDTPYLPVIRFSPCGYGGSFTPYNIIEKCTLPDKKYFVYFDDVLFFSKIVRDFDVSIYKIDSPRIQDIDQSFSTNNIYKSFFLQDSNNNKIYYWIRNRILLTLENYQGSKIISIFNFSFWIFYIFIIGLLNLLKGKISIKVFLKKSKIIFLAFKNGLTKNKEKLLF